MNARTALLALSLLACGLPTTALADDCSGSFRSGVYVEGDDGDDHAYIFTYYNKTSDTYCSTMVLSAKYDNKKRNGGVLHYVCSDGLNAQGSCRGRVAIAPDRDDGARKRFGPIRVRKGGTCVQAFGYLEPPLNSFARSKWHCS